ncbi:hypothetical protein LTR37_008590 [Vermiconidia calcicola]|uniref:Uncharacterized protein n=1 Tax=Vermiconidia calcicola TaxID=1690605 RepID=A0ACC3NB01_9PEZI|nr:hypothetical protein LTR37_008590 [Vermiconidia calcicola]
MGKPTTSALPQGFLTTPAPNITASRINFAETPVPAYKDLYAVVLDNVLSPSECETLVRAAEATQNNGWERAMINIGGGKQRLMTEERNCGRIIWDSREVVAKIWNLIEHVPEVQEIVRLENVPKISGNGPAKRGEVWKFSRPNERMRFLKYVGGEYFRPHCDGSYETPDRKERTYFTLHLYLNNAGVITEGELQDLNPQQRSEAYKNVLVGGATTFHAYNMRDKYDVLPKAGRILLFQHRDLIHSGDDVLQGVKYTMRTDLLYSLETTKSEERRSKMPVLEDDASASSEEGTDGMAEAQKYGYM